jgi:hypothetical protein
LTRQSPVIRRERWQIGVARRHEDSEVHEESPGIPDEQVQTSAVDSFVKFDSFVPFVV